MIDPTVVVLAEISAERARQDALWGVQNLPMGTGPNTAPLLPVVNIHAGVLEKIFRTYADVRAQEGTLTFADVLLEEVFEALAADNLEDVREELVQVAALAVKGVEMLDRYKLAGGDWR